MFLSPSNIRCVAKVRTNAADCCRLLIQLNRDAETASPEGESYIQDVVNIPSRTGVPYNYAGVAQNHNSAWHIEEHVSSGADECVVSDCDLSHHDRVGSNPDTIFNGWGALARTRAGRTDGYALCNINAPAQDCVGTDDDSAEVPNIQPRPDRCGRRNIEAIPHAVVVEQDSVVDITEESQASLCSGIMSYFAQVVCKSESWMVSIGRDHCSTTGAATVAVGIRLDSSPRSGVQVFLLLS